MSRHGVQKVHINRWPRHHHNHQSCGEQDHKTGGWVYQEFELRFQKEAGRLDGNQQSHGHLKRLKADGVKTGKMIKVVDVGFPP